MLFGLGATADGKGERAIWVLARGLHWGSCEFEVFGAGLKEFMVSIPDEESGDRE